MTRDQLRSLGLGGSAIQHRLHNGRLFRVHRGVYSLGRPPSLPLEWASAAVLACGPDAALSHGSAYTLWGWAIEWHRPLHVTATGRHRRPGIVVHESTTLTRADVRTQLGIRATSPARTLLDCAPELSPRALRRTVAQARRDGLLHPAALLDLLARNPSHRGAAALRATITDQAPTRSEFEELFPSYCARHGLPVPLINVVVAGRERDAYFPDHGLIVELDGWDFHRDRQAFEDDRERDAAALVLGLVTVRLTWERMIRRPAREADRLRAIAAQRSGWTAPRPAGLPARAAQPPGTS